MSTMRRRSLCAAALCALAAAPSFAGQPQRAADPPAYQAECASCHIAYPARFLPADSWRALMGNLGAHFGTDASLDPHTAATILQYLEANARSRPGVDAPLRITETRWFRREHAELSARWTHPAVKSAANCGACHAQAADGNFSERTLHVPK